MAYSFKTTWNDAIAEVSTREEFQTARIRIEDPSLLTQSDYDIETGEWTIIGDPVIYPVGDETGQARIIGVRWGVQSGGESQANATTISAIRVQVPQHAVGRVKKGCKVFVGSAPNTVLQGYVFTVTSDMQGSSDAARTFECALDIDSIRGVEVGVLTVSGTDELAVAVSHVTPENAELTYQWFLRDEDGVTAIPGATSDSLPVNPAWAGLSVFVSVTGSATSYRPTTRKSEEVEING